MKRIWGISIAALSFLVAVGAAEAQKRFDDAARGAEEIRNPRALAALFWSQTAACGKSQSDLAKRQCEGIRRARLAQVPAGTYLVDGDDVAFEAGAYDAKKKSVPIKLLTCLACAAAVDVDGAKHFVVGAKGAVSVAGAAIKGPEAYTGDRKFKSEAAANRWIEDAVPRLRTQFVVRVPKQAAKWKKGKFAGFKVDVLAYRVYDPCDGKVIAAKPKAESMRADKRYCTGEPVVEKPEGEKPEVKKPEVKKPALPAVLSSSQIKEALAPAREAASKCYEVYGVPGMARFRISINNEGAVIALEQLRTSDFVDTPTGECIEKAIKGVTFPKTRKKRTTIDYPFMLR